LESLLNSTPPRLILSCRSGLPEANTLPQKDSPWLLRRNSVILAKKLLDSEKPQEQSTYFFT